MANDEMQTKEKRKNKESLIMNNDKMILIYVLSMLLLIGGLVAVYYIGTFLVGGAVAEKSSQEMEETREKDKLASLYITQNVALAMNRGADIKQDEEIDFAGYRPYEQVRETYLQTNLNCYTQETGQILTLMDVREFLENAANPDSTPKTYLDNQQINAYITWYASTDVLFDYRTQIDSLLFAYDKENNKDKSRKTPYRFSYSFESLTPDQVNELHKKYLDPDYETTLDL
ncbi:MAG: hypothetical protein FWG14_07690 [Peptococcaceae bacterium]|nr:hypothetical protein [Peptococcaceae bacterium]